MSDSSKSLAPRRVVLGLFGLLVLLALRILYAWTLRVDSDEPQHLHIVWAWTQHLLPYRDVFDNHTPLFQWLLSPALAFLGERADIVALMRIAVIPFYLLTLAAAWWMARRLWSVRVAWVATLLLAVFPIFFIPTVQFRTDDLWAPLWVLAVAVLVSGRLSVTRLALTGLLVGLDFAVSLKTLPLLLTALTTGILLALMWRIRFAHWSLKPWLRGLLPFLLMSALPLGLFALFFALHHAWSQAWYGTVLHNMTPGLGDWRDGIWRFLFFPAALLWMSILAWRRLASSPHPQQTLRRLFVLVSAILYIGALFSFWPLLTVQDLLPVLPLLFVATVGAYLLGSGRKATLWVSVILVVEIGLLFVLRPPWQDQYLREEHLLAKVLQYSRPGTYVMDAKGAAIFRPRPIYWVFEDVTLRRIQLGLIQPHLQADLIRTATPLLMNYRIPTWDQRFIARSYLPLAGRLWVAGQRFPLLAGQPRIVNVGIPQSYVLVDAKGPVAGTIDGHDIQRGQAWHLTSGKHRISAARSGVYVLVWAPAVTRGLQMKVLFPSRP